MKYPQLKPAIGAPILQSPRSPFVSARRLNNLKLISTFVLLFSIAIASIAALLFEDPDQVLSYSSAMVGTGMTIAFLVEGRGGLRNLLRVDLFMLVVLYLLTFFEFLLTQDTIIGLISLDATQTAVLAVLLGFGGIALGRHAFSIRHPLAKTIELRISPSTTVRLLIACALLGYLYMLIAVRFDILELFYQLTRPRFSQPWTRGRLGGLSTLLNELALLKYLIPPVAAVILVNRKRHRTWHILLALSLLALVFFESFAGGTRNVFLSHLMTFLAAYSLLLPRLTFRRLAVVFVPISAVAYFAIYYMPEIRTVGLQNIGLAIDQTDTLFVDMNMINIALLTEVFPSQSDYLGFEIPYNAAIRPIPRALWPGKPEGLSLGIEEALGVSGMTLAATFIGEFWMAGGYFAIFFAAIFLGATASYWNRRGAKAKTTLDVITFSIGFFAAGIAMRSFLSVFPTLLPILALYFYRRVKWR